MGIWGLSSLFERVLWFSTVLMECSELCVLGNKLEFVASRWLDGSGAAFRHNTTTDSPASPTGKQHKWELTGGAAMCNGSARRLSFLFD